MQWQQQYTGDVAATVAALHAKNLLWRTWMELSKGLIELAIFCGWHQRVAKQARQAALNSALKKDEGGRASLTCLAEVCFATKETFFVLFVLAASKQIPRQTWTMPNMYTLVE